MSVTIGLSLVQSPRLCPIFKLILSVEIVLIVDTKKKVMTSIDEQRRSLENQQRNITYTCRHKTVTIRQKAYLIMLHESRKLSDDNLYSNYTQMSDRIFISIGMSVCVHVRGLTQVSELCKIWKLWERYGGRIFPLTFGAFMLDICRK